MHYGNSGKAHKEHRIIVAKAAHRAFDKNANIDDRGASKQSEKAEKSAGRLPLRSAMDWNCLYISLSLTI